MVHTVGPVWQGGASDEPELLRSCYTNSLRLAEEAGATSIAFPNISTGVYHYPKERAAKIALAAVRDHHAGTLTDVVFACFDTENYQFYASLL